MSLTQTVPIHSVHLVFASVLNLICFSWLVDKLHFFIVLLFISQLFRDNASQQCVAGGDLYSIYQMMLKGHTYKSFKTAPGTLECREACLSDVKCQSYNVAMFIAICELNNRTKEARPEDFVKNKDRYYMAKGPKRGEDFTLSAMNLSYSYSANINRFNCSSSRINSGVARGIVQGNQDE